MPTLIDAAAGGASPPECLSILGPPPCACTPLWTCVSPLMGTSCLMDGSPGGFFCMCEGWMCAFLVGALSVPWPAGACCPASPPAMPSGSHGRCHQGVRLPWAPQCTVPLVGTNDHILDVTWNGRTAMCMVHVAVSSRSDAVSAGSPSVPSSPLIERRSAAAVELRPVHTAAAAGREQDTYGRHAGASSTCGRVMVALEM